jgi:IS5 family transposase
LLDGEVAPKKDPQNPDKGSANPRGLVTRKPITCGHLQSRYNRINQINCLWDRDIARKIAGDAALESAFAVARNRVGRLLAQKRDDKNKLYALHAPEVECIGKGKARTRYEFGVKTSIAVTNARTAGGQFIIGMQALPGNPYDGHTISGQIEQVQRLTGVAVERAYSSPGWPRFGVPCSRGSLLPSWPTTPPPELPQPRAAISRSRTSLNGTRPALLPASTCSRTTS